MKEVDIRPSELFNTYISMSAADAQKMDSHLYVTIQCPGCHGSDSKVKIKKQGFVYRYCNDCGSVYCSPRPTDVQLDTLYTSSKSAKFWATDFFPAVAESRREKIFKPKASLVDRILKERDFQPGKICDVGAGYGIFLEELQKSLSCGKFFAIEPAKSQADICRNKGFETMEANAESALEWHTQFDLVICSEVIEHVFSPDEFIQSILALLKPGGLLIMSGLGYEGFDILELQEASRSISPPHHLNFLSISGFRKLLQRNGCEKIDIRTPGKLDVDIVLNSEKPPEWLKILAQRGEAALDEFQQLIAKYNMSSHVWAIAQRKESENFD